MRKKSEMTSWSNLGMIGRSDVPPDQQRRRVLKGGMAILLAFAATGAPYAVWALSEGRTLPIFAVLAIAASALWIGGTCRLGRSEWAGRAFIVSVMALGAMLSLLDPRLTDFGMGATLLGPVLASLLGDRIAKRAAWALVGALIVTTAVFMNLPSFPSRLYLPDLELVSGVVYAAYTVITIYFAHQLNFALRQAENAKLGALHQLIEQLHSAVIRLAPDDSTPFISRSAETLFNCKRYELSGNGFVERIHLQDRPAYLTALSAARRDGRATTLDLRMRRDDPLVSTTVPQFIWVELVVSPVIEEGGPATKNAAMNECFLLVRDISARKRQEHEMREARKSAQQASEAKSRFLATIGHELRTPLNAIVGFSDMMTSELVGPMEENQKEYAHLIHKSGMHLLDVVNMLLDMSKIEAGKFELQLEKFAPEKLVEPCVQIVEPMAAERDVRVIGDADFKLPEVTGDERAYRQIVINLLSNAVKFSHAGGTVRFDIKRQGGRLLISVTDNGIGMNKDEIDRIGEPFFQAQSDAARRYEGTGLGLSIVKGLVELHDGQIDVRSKKGHGTTVSVLMPLKGPIARTADSPVVQPLHPRPRLVEPEPTTKEKKSVAQ